MDASAQKTPAPIVHPASRIGTGLIVLAGMLAVPVLLLAVAEGFRGQDAVTLLVLAGSATLGVWYQRVLSAVTTYNAALGLLVEGRIEESAALLDTIPRSRRTGLVGTMVLGQRALALSFQGDAAGSIVASGEALARRPSLLARTADADYRAWVRSTRALMFAALGDAEAARAEAARVDAARHARGELRGVASLARAALHARDGERAELAAELARSRPFIDALTGRMASLARSLARLAAAPAEGASRSSAERSDELSAVGRWVAKVVPAAAPFAPRGEETRAAVDPARWPTSTHEARIKVRADRALARRRAPGRWRVVVPATVGLVAGETFALWPHPPTEQARVYAFDAAIGAAMLLWAWRFVSRGRAIRAARSLYDAGSADESDAALSTPARSTISNHAAAARFELALHAEARDDLPAALDHVESGLGQLLTDSMARAVSNDLVFPGLVALRARALAALGRTDEALAELELLARDFPGYALAAPTVLLVRTVAALRGGDRALARDFVRSRAADVELTRHGELLFALLLGEAGCFEADGERERIDAELAAHPGSASWVERVAPGLIGSLRPVSAVRGAR